MSFQTDLYDDMLQRVISLTSRPDLEAETELALVTATSGAHHSDFYSRDFDTKLVQIPNAAYAVQLDIANLFPRLRGIDTIVPVDVSNNPLTGEDFEVDVVEIGDLVDEDGFKRTNVAYLAGSSLNILTRIAVNGFIVGWYSTPSTSRNNYNSWIAQLLPQIIIFWAASIVLGTNGNEEKAARYMKMVMGDPMNNIGGLIHELKANYLVGKAR